MNGIHSQPASKKATFKPGWRSSTPPAVTSTKPVIMQKLKERVAASKTLSKIAFIWRDDQPTWTATGADKEDDARWRGAAGHSINVGSPTAPLNFRALYTGSGDTREAVLQWRVNVGVAPGSRRDFYLGLQSPTDASATYVVRFSFPAGTTSTQGGFTQCSQSDSVAGVMAGPWSIIPCFAD